MKRNDIKVIENLYYEDGYPKYYIVLAKDIENESATGESYDYNLSNSESGCEEALFDAIRDAFDVDTSDFGLYGDDNHIEYEGYDDDITEEKIAEINAFAKSWRAENEYKVNCLWYNYFDGSNWQSLLLSSDDDYVDSNKQYELLNDDDAEDIIAAFDRAKDESCNVDWQRGYKTIHDEETGYDIRFSQYSNAVGIADIF